MQITASMTRFSNSKNIACRFYKKVELNHPLDFAPKLKKLKCTSYSSDALKTFHSRSSDLRLLRAANQQPLNPQEKQQINLHNNQINHIIIRNQNSMHDPP
jgi:hypothetical protein